MTFRQALVAIDTYMHTFTPSGSIAPGNLKHYLSLVGIEPSLLIRETLVCYFGYARNIWFATFVTLLSTETAIYNLTNRSNKLPKFTVFFPCTLSFPQLPLAILQYCVYFINGLTSVVQISLHIFYLGQR